MCCQVPSIWLLLHQYLFYSLDTQVFPLLSCKATNEGISTLQCWQVGSALVYTYLQTASTCDQIRSWRLHLSWTRTRNREDPTAREQGRDPWNWHDTDRADTKTTCMYMIAPQLADKSNKLASYILFSLFNRGNKSNSFWSGHINQRSCLGSGEGKFMF